MPHFIFFVVSGRIQKGFELFLFLMLVGGSFALVDAVKKSVVPKWNIQNGLIDMDHFVNHGCIEHSIGAVTGEFQCHTVHVFGLGMNMCMTSAQKTTNRGRPVAGDCGQNTFEKRLI